MRRNLHVVVLAAILAAVGTAIFLYKVTSLGFPLSAGQQANSWNVELKMSFQDTPGPFKATLALPSKTGHYVISRQAYVSGDYGVTHDGDAAGNQLVIFSKRDGEGDETLYYRAHVASYPQIDDKVQAPEPRVSPPAWTGSERAAANSLLDNIRANSADRETLALNLIDELTASSPGENVTALLPPDASQDQLAQTAAKVLRTDDIPARSVHGLDLSKGAASNVALAHWIEVYDNGFWRPIGLESETRALPEGHLPWWRGDRPLVQWEGAEEIELNMSFAHTRENALEAAVQRGLAMDAPLLRFSLFNTSLETQLLYQVLLLIPVGALVLTLMRQVVGIATFGTFMPVLIALAFRETQLLNGVLLFTVIVSLGLLVRFYFERLKLLLVPRLASMLIVVVLMMAAFSVLTEQIGTSAGLSIALFPMVILTMTIERMSIVWEEDGPKDAIQQGLGSLGVATLVYLVMFNDLVEYLTFTFPELLLILLALTLLLGRYTGYRLVELWRFRDIAKERTA
ncbi:UUP1 family membrane protein [Rhodovibrio salinarum]|uniref:Inactive transglutaminase fused to 7 transmembrane helices n=1 Tax=Rhodovibrio salinarum TaxID=1087 RepID=A0A934QFP8_9PROT|nr:UUP1 family membrane protein [Rhodovibrio salinarum]MBK1695913.1 hypothetical protein [Rhodovibrio salinarum]